MLVVASALKAYLVEATDGNIGSVHDCLFDDRTWTLRWLVVDTREWLIGRKVLIHPSAFGRPDVENLRLRLDLTKAQIEASPPIAFDRPVSAQLESRVYGYYGWDAEWGGIGYPAHLAGASAVTDKPGAKYAAGPDDGDPNLRSMAAVGRYHVAATDGAIGHVEDFVFDDVTWDVRYLIVDTKNWWFGQHVLIAPFAVRHINWLDETVLLDLSRERVQSSPPWKPLDLIDIAYQRQLHSYYGWPGYGW